MGWWEGVKVILVRASPGDCREVCVGLGRGCQHLRDWGEGWSVW